MLFQQNFSYKLTASYPFSVLRRMSSTYPFTAITNLLLNFKTLCSVFSCLEGAQPFKSGFKPMTYGLEV